MSFYSRISDDLSFASKVAGVLVESGTEVQNKLKGKYQLSTHCICLNNGKLLMIVFFSWSLAGFSPERKFPQAEFIPYNNTRYEWNPMV